MDYINILSVKQTSILVYSTVTLLFKYDMSCKTIDLHAAAQVVHEKKSQSLGKIVFDGYQEPSQVIRSFSQLNVEERHHFVSSERFLGL